MLEKVEDFFRTLVARPSPKPNNGLEGTEKEKPKVKKRIRNKITKVKAPPTKKKNEKKIVIYSIFVLDAALLIAGVVLFALKPTCKIQATTATSDDLPLISDDNTTFYNPICGTQEIRPNLDIYTNSANKYSWPWLARLRKKTGSKGHSKTPVCSGTVITTLYVISACHCVEVKPSPSDFLVSIGDHVDRHTGEELLEVAKLRRHPYCVLPAIGEYTFELRSHDLLLVTLKENIQLDIFVVPACLPEPKMSLTEAQTCRIYYWTTAENGILQQFSPKIISQSSCASVMTDAFKFKTPPPYFAENHFFCTKIHAGDKECMQVGGGPMTCLQEDKWILYGIASWGLDCGFKTKSGIYSVTSNYLSWICCYMEANPSCRGVTCKF